MAEPRTLSDFEVQRLQQGRLRRAVRATIDAARARGTVLDPVARLVADVADHVTAEVGLLAWTAARWGELRSLEVEQLQHDGRSWIWMPKVEAWRKTPKLGDCEREQWRALNPDVEIPCQPRKRVAQHVRRALRDRGLTPPPDVLAGTHLVRHLTASAMEWGGAPRDAIARRLGHEDEQTTADYIHTKAAWQPA